MAGRPRSVTDEQIFDALAAVITSVGPADVTLDRVGARLGLTGAAVGHRFGSKRGLLLAFAARQAAAADAHFARHRAEVDDPLDALVAALVSLAGALATRRAVANNLAMFALDITDRTLRRHAIAQAEVIRRWAAALVVEAGLVPADRAEELADQLYVTWSGAVMTWAVDGTGPLHAAIEYRLRRTLAHRAG